MAGIQAALDLADAGHQVYLVEEQASIGGIMAALDKTFPTMDCSICVLGPKMMDVGRHPRIKLLAYSKVEQVSGYVGNFKVKIRRKARYVDEEACTACGKCAEVCPVVLPDEFQQGFSSRKGIHIPFAQAVPSAYLIDMKNCLGNNPVACVKCVEACDKKCIDLNAKDKIEEIEVGSIIVATGMGVYDPTQLAEYGYGRFENVITTMEFERLICGGGPTDGHLVRPSDHKTPKRIGFIQCVGSRTDNRGNPYCSNVCCMNTIKDSLLILEHYPDTEIYVFYMDIRAFGKGFEDLFRRSKEAGVHYIRGLPGEITEDAQTKNLRLKVENTTVSRLEEYPLDMVVLSVGLEPKADLKQLANLLESLPDSDGFLMEAHPKLKPVDAPTPGIFYAGSVEAPKDIKDSVTQAGAAAARSSILLNAGKIKSEAIKAQVIVEKCTSCGACAKVCPYGAIKVDIKAKTGAQITAAACAGCGTCAAECRFDAITMQHFSDDQIMAQISAALSEEPAEEDYQLPVQLVQLCRRRPGRDFAACNIRPITALSAPCAADGSRKNSFCHAFEKGAPIVLVSGCHINDCHYINANHQTQKRVERLWERMKKLGIRPERLQLEWISAAEGPRFAEIMRGLEEMRQKVTAEEIEFTRKVLSAQRTSKESVSKQDS